MDAIKYVERLRTDFPALKTVVNGHKIAYLDNAATTQKPQQVIEAISRYYEESNANVHRGVHFLSEAATEAYEQARLKTQRFINATLPEECIFVRGTTEGINLVATSFGQQFVRAGDEIIVSMMEHHSNLVPWMMLCERTGARLKVIPVTEDGRLDLTGIGELFSAKTKLMAITHVSNSLGTINPVKDLIARAHDHGVPVLVDGAQAVAHLTVDVQDLDCDFYVFSAHKCYGPMGVGVLYGKKSWLEQMPPYQGGGDMILQVSFEQVKYNHLPYKFEAGTPSVADAVGWGAAIDYLQQLNFKLLATHKADLLKYAMARLREIPRIKFYGDTAHKVPVISFNIEQIHAHDLGTIVNEGGVAIRTGHHCNMPLMDFYQISGTARASIGIYNSISDIDCLCDNLIKACRIFAGK